MNIVIVLAGGKGTRMMQDIPKQFIDLDGKPIVAHTLEKFNNCRAIDGIVVVCIESHKVTMKEICDKFYIDKLINVISGGDTRHQSILCGLRHVEEKYGTLDDIKVLLHNANMPLVTEENINSCINDCKDLSDITTSVAKCTGYFYNIEQDNSLGLGPDRNNIVSAKVPEAMYLKTALDLYERDCFKEKQYESYTAGMLGIISGLKVIPVVCETTNMKVTTPDDFELVKTYFRNQKKG